MAKLNDDEIKALADRAYGDDDRYDTENQRLFSLLVDVAGACYRSYLDEDRPDIDRPETFTPSTLGGVPMGWSMLEGLRENMQMNMPDGIWYLPGQPVGLENIMVTDTNESECPFSWWQHRSQQPGDWPTPEWAKIDCAGEINPRSGLCEAHHNAQPPE